MTNETQTQVERFERLTEMEEFRGIRDYLEARELFTRIKPRTYHRIPRTRGQSYTDVTNVLSLGDPEILGKAIERTGSNCYFLKISLQGEAEPASSRDFYEVKVLEGETWWKEGKYGDTHFVSKTGDVRVDKKGHLPAVFHLSVYLPDHWNDVKNPAVVLPRGLLARLNEEDCRTLLRQSKSLLEIISWDGFGRIFFSVPHEGLIKQQIDRPEDWISYLPLDEHSSEGYPRFREYCRNSDGTKTESLIWSRPNEFYAGILADFIQPEWRKENPDYFNRLVNQIMQDESNTSTLDLKSLERFKQKGIPNSPTFFNLGVAGCFDGAKDFARHGF